MTLRSSFIILRFITYALTPAAAASILYSGFSWTVIMTTRTSGKTSLIRRVASSPFIRRFRISFNARLNANIESYIHTNKDFTEWQYGYEERLPILNSDIELWLLVVAR